MIFVSIDDHEVHHLRMLMNEVFGEENFIATCVWQKRYSRENRGIIGDVHDYLVFLRPRYQPLRVVRNSLPLNDESKAVYKNPNNDPKGDWRRYPDDGTRSSAQPDVQDRDAYRGRALPAKGPLLEHDRAGVSETQ